MQNSIPVVHVGLGPLGIHLLRLMAERPVFSLTGAVDIRPDLLGQNVAHLTGKSQFAGDLKRVRLLGKTGRPESEAGEIRAATSVPIATCSAPASCTA